MTISEDVVEQAEQCLRNIEAALTEAGAGFADVVRVRYLLPDRADFEPCWPVLRARFGQVRPMVVPFIPGTNALWDPWHGSHNGKGLTEDAFDNATKVILNQDFTSGLTQPSSLLDYFPYLAPPPAS
jgi:enamine deaminase RidA (YjgF/YER057c/UK114 family)